MKKIFITLLCAAISFPVFSQGNISGSLEANTNFYMRDSLIGAYGTPQYDNLLSSTDAWLSLNYFNPDWDLTAGARLDLFNNSILIDPTRATSGIGLGRIYASKVIGNLTITGGHFYDQFGSGITFRAYEERPLAIDNSILGLHLNYQLSDNWTAKGFTGRQKRFFDTYDPIIKGLNLEGFHQLRENISFAPGASIVNRTMDQASMNVVVSNINSLPLEQRFVPSYNVFAYSFYNRLNFANFSWFAEYAGKTNEAIIGADGNLINVPGSVIYSYLTYSRAFAGRGVGVTGHIKRTENFTLRTSPNQILLDGVINFLPPLTRQSTYTLPARYNAATQELGELAYQFDIFATPARGISITLNHSNVTDLNNVLLFREFYGDLQYRRNRNWSLTGGLQVINYNQQVFELKGTDNLRAITPFTEFTYRFTRRNSLRTELQYMHTEDDFGSWIFALVEYNIAPRFSFAITDMYNINPQLTDEGIHYYSVFGSYTQGANRYSASFVRQVEGVVCTGGVCRYEPAFSGVRFTINSTF